MAGSKVVSLAFETALLERTGSKKHDFDWQRTALLLIHDLRARDVEERWQSLEENFFPYILSINPEDTVEAAKLLVVCADAASYLEHPFAIAQAFADYISPIIANYRDREILTRHDSYSIFFTIYQMFEPEVQARVLCENAQELAPIGKEPHETTAMTLRFLDQCWNILPPEYRYEVFEHVLIRAQHSATKNGYQDQAAVFRYIYKNIIPKLTPEERLHELEMGYLHGRAHIVKMFDADGFYNVDGVMAQIRQQAEADLATPVTPEAGAPAPR